MEVLLKKLYTLRDDAGMLLNPRGEAGDTTDLQTSLHEEGQIDPIVVGPADAKGNYPIIHGHRRLAALQGIKAKTAKIFVAEQIDVTDESKVRSMMAATTASVRVKPSMRGKYIKAMMVRKDNPWALEKCAAVMGLAIDEARNLVRLAELFDTEPQFVARVDLGDVPWSVFKNRLARAPRAVRERVTDMGDGKITRDTVERVVREAAKPTEASGQSLGLRSEELIRGLNEARLNIQRALVALDKPMHEADCDRISTLLDQIAVDLGKEHEGAVGI